MNNIILSPIEKNELIQEIAEAVISRLQPLDEKAHVPEELLQTPQVMKLLGRSRTTIKVWRDLGLLKHQIINSRVYLFITNIKSHSICDAFRLKKGYTFLI